MDDQEQYAENFEEESRYEQAEEIGGQEEVPQKTYVMILSTKINILIW